MFTGAGIGVDGSAVKVGIAVGSDVADVIGAGVNEAMAVSTSPDGWKGVGVGEEFGSCVTRMKVGN